MTPIQVTVRFPAQAGRTWRVRPSASAPRVGAIVPRGWDVTPTVEEAAEGTFEVALLATDQAAAAWAWQVRDPSNHRRVIAVPAASADGVVDYADLLDVDPSDPESIKAPAAVPSPSTATSLEQTPPWLLDVVRDLARRTAEAEAFSGTPGGMDPIDASDPGVQAYMDGFRRTTSGHDSE